MVLLWHCSFWPSATPRIWSCLATPDHSCLANPALPFSPVKRSTGLPARLFLASAQVRKCVAGFVCVARSKERAVCRCLSTRAALRSDSRCTLLRHPPPLQFCHLISIIGFGLFLLSCRPLVSIPLVARCSFQRRHRLYPVASQQVREHPVHLTRITVAKIP